MSSLVKPLSLLFGGVSFDSGEVWREHIHSDYHLRFGSELLRRDMTFVETGTSFCTFT